MSNNSTKPLAEESPLGEDSARPENEIVVDSSPDEAHSEAAVVENASASADQADSAKEIESEVPQPQASPPTEHAEEPAAEEPAVDEPLVEEPAVEEVSAEEPIVEEPAAQEPTVEELEGEGVPEKEWYILKVQVNRENSIRDALIRRIKIEGLEEFFGDILVPTEDVAEFDKNGKKRVVKKKLYPGYIVANVAVTDDTWFLVRETPGIGDFTGAAGKPSPMAPHEVKRILASTLPGEATVEAVKTAIPFKVDDKVRVKEGYFQNFEGVVESIDEANGRVTVMINIFGRSTPVELEHWQIEDV